MKYKLLNKGLEVELYAGTKEGEVLPLSTKIIEYLPDFSQEPDQRNFEYITKPTRDYTELFKEIAQPRINIRNFLKRLDDNLVLIPGSTIPLAFDKSSYPSKPDEPYHKYILNTYKTSIITTSLHINIGIYDYENLFKLLCALRLDTPLFLALSASSCFHNGKLTGFHSYRWHSFPKTRAFVPFFTNHNSYINWTNEQLSLKSMQNIRHLWTSIRPNGPKRPFELNRIEIRICDLVTDITKALAIVSFIECIIQKYLLEDSWPKIIRNSQSNLNEIVALIEKQEELVAKDSLDAQVWDWRNDTKKEAREIIESLYKDLTNTADKLNVLNFLRPITDILRDGNEATQFLSIYNGTKSVQKTIQHFIEQFTIMDLKANEAIKKPTSLNL